MVEFYRKVSLDNGSFSNYVKNYLNNIHVDIYNSSNIEGNTITLSDTAKLVKGVSILETYMRDELLEINNLNDLYKCLLDDIEKPLSVELICDAHYTLSKELAKHNPGELRSVNVDTVEGGAGYSDYSVVEAELQYMCDNFNSLNSPSLLEIAELKVDFIKTHPFEDGNGRLSRYLLNWALLRSNYIPIVIPVAQRTEYINSLKQSTNSDATPFHHYIEKLLIEQYKQITSSISTNPYV